MEVRAFPRKRVAYPTSAHIIELHSKQLRLKVLSFCTRPCDHRVSTLQNKRYVVYFIDHLHVEYDTRVTKHSQSNTL